MKNVEKADKVHLGALMEELKKGHYVIPDFQREFEWQPWDVLDLIKSIFMDYYIGTLLLWKGSKDNYKMLSCEPIYAFDGNESPQHIVLDGQQRLTAIYYAFFRPDKVFPRRAKAMVYFMNIQSYLDEDYEKAFWYDSLTKKNKELLANKESQFEQHIFPLCVMKEGTWGTTDWIKEYRDYWQDWADKIDENEEGRSEIKSRYQNYADSAKVFKDALEDMFNNYNISYIELDRDIDIAKVCDIFTQINSKGVTLDIFDLLNAILRPKDIYLKNMWNNAKGILQYTDEKKMKIYVLQVMSILEQSYCSAKYLYYLVPEAVKTIKKPDGSKEKVVLVDSAEEFIRRWHEAVKALEKAIKNLKNPRDYGAITPGFVPYPSIIPAFASIKYYVDCLDTPKKLDIQTKIRKWYWASVFTNRYSSSVESTSAKDFQDLKKWFEDDYEVPAVYNDFVSNYNSIDLKQDNPKGSAIYNAIFNLFVINEARDWATFDLPEYDSLDDHHIVPYSVFRETAGSSINSILNRTPLSADTNRKIIRTRMPNEYLKEMFENNDPEKVYAVLASHLISKKAVAVLLRDPFTKEDFEEFLSIRQGTIRNAIENMLIREKIGIQVALQALNESIEKVELQLRNVIISTLGNGSDAYKLNTPSHIQEKVEKRIKNEISKKPGMTADNFEQFSDKLKFFDLFELYDFIVSKSNWPAFIQKFRNKEQLQNRFNQLSSLRNCIRHSREVTEIERLDGEAAIVWFNQILKSGI